MADFQGGNVSADGGVLLLREIDSHTGMIDQLAACFTDHRRPELIEHTLPELLRQRILGMAMEYEDLNCMTGHTFCRAPIDDRRCPKRHHDVPRSLRGMARPSDQ